MHLVTYPCVYKKCAPSIWGQGHTLGCLSWPRPLIRWATNIITLPICPRSHVASDSGWTLLLFGAAVHTLHCVLLDTNHTVCQTRIKRALQHPCTWLRTSCCSDGNASFNAWAKRTFTWSLDSLKIKSRTHSNRRCKRDKWWSKGTKLQISEAQITSSVPRCLTLNRSERRHILPHCCLDRHTRSHNKESVWTRQVIGTGW